MGELFYGDVIFGHDPSGRLLSKDQQRSAKIGKESQRLAKISKDAGKYRKHTFKRSKDCPVRFGAYYTIGTKAHEAIFAQILEF